MASTTCNNRFFADHQDDRPTIRLWEVSTGKEVRQIIGTPGGCYRVAFSNDGRTLLTAGEDGTARLWEVATGKERMRFVGHRGPVIAAVLSRDGRIVITGSSDTTVLLWDATGLIREGRLPKLTLPPEELNACWVELAGENAERAYRSAWKLAASPAEAVAFLRKHLQPALAADAKRQAKLIADLDSEQFAVRAAAAKELEKLGETASEACRKALEGELSAEARRRLQALVDNQARDAWEPSSEQLRTLRALEALELAGTPEARDLLMKLSAGAAETRLAREAKAALARLARP